MLKEPSYLGMDLSLGFQQLVTDSDEGYTETSGHEQSKVEGQLHRVVGVKGEILTGSRVTMARFPSDGGGELSHRVCQS